MTMKHNHAEAFALMKYASKDGAVVEMIWNSRDGVTPFTLMSKDDRVEMQHVEWKSDLYAPDHPHTHAPDHPHTGLKVGDRVFVDMTMERGRQVARAQIEWVRKSIPETDVETPEETEQLITDMAQSWVDGGDPDIVVVDEKLLAELQAKAPKILTWTERTGHSGRHG